MSDRSAVVGLGLGVILLLFFAIATGMRLYSQ